MPLSFRSLTGFMILLILASCGGNNGTAGTSLPADTLRSATLQDSLAVTQPGVHYRMTDTMLSQIIDYYRNTYGGDSIRMDAINSDTLLELRFADTATSPEGYHGTLFVAYIALNSDNNAILDGDMNGDGISDRLVSIHTEGGGGGGNVWWTDHFLFLAGQNGEQQLADVKGDGEIMDGSGYFFPDNIADQSIMGTGNGYAESDGHCCPSLYYSLHVQFRNGALITTAKTAIAKPAGF